MIGVGEPGNSECPGSVGDPRAASGNLCVYLGFLLPSQGEVRVVDPGVNSLFSNGISFVTQTASTIAHGDGRVAPFGFQLEYEPEPRLNTSNVRASWAVTG